MEMRKCPNGHYYDVLVNTSCPYCNGGDANSSDPGATSSRMPAPNWDDEGKTLAKLQTEDGVDPVVGWLVCLTGKEKGRDYRIHADNNFIGRSERMDICIKGDETVSRENQAVLTYDTLKNTFRFSPGDGRSIVRVNKEAVYQTTEIKIYDKLTIGNTELLFVPLCGENFEWEE